MVQIVPKESLSVHDIWEQNLSSTLSIPFYNAAIKQGDEFLYVLGTGIPYSCTELSFANISGDSLYKTPVEIDKAYRFAKLVNMIVKPEEHYNMEVSLESFPIHFDVPEPYKLTSALYDDDFFLTIVNPPYTNDTNSWTRIEKTTCYMQNLKSGIKYTLPGYTFKTNVVVLNIERPWLTSLQLPHTMKYAIIKKLILAKRTNIASYAGGVASISIKGEKVKRVKIKEPAMTMQTLGTVIVGFTLVLL